MRRSTWLLLFYVGIYVAYLVIGAWAMWFFEINNENMLRKGTNIIWPNRILHQTFQEYKKWQKESFLVVDETMD